MVPLEGVTLVEERCWRVAMYVGGHLKSPPGLEGWHSGECLQSMQKALNSMPSTHTHACTHTHRHNSHGGGGF